MIIIGAGTIGQLAIQCARAMGARSVTAIDINDDRLKLARQIGAETRLTARSLALQR